MMYDSSSSMDILMRWGRRNHWRNAVKFGEWDRSGGAPLLLILITQQIPSFQSVWPVTR